jgi:DNA-binding XRE family transcriptional regulator
VQPKKKTGRKRNMATKELVKKVWERFRRKANWSVPKMAKELDVSRISLRNIVKNDLKLKLSKKQVHGITEAQKENPCMARW